MLMCVIILINTLFAWAFQGVHSGIIIPALSHIHSPGIDGRFPWCTTSHNS